MRIAASILALCATVGLAGCGSGTHGPGVPSLQASHANGGGSRPSAATLHAAAECVREHGIPSYADPTVGPDFTIYTDQRDLEKAGDAAVAQAMNACRTLILAAHFDPSQRPHPPAQMVRDGVREAACLRAHGLPNWPDPKPTDTFDPGHGFQVTGDAFAGAVPAGANPKQSSAFHNAIQACSAESQAVSRDSELSNLAHGQ